MTIAWYLRVGLLHGELYYLQQEEDRLLLEMLIKKEEKEDVLQTARREKARADAQWMKQVGFRYCGKLWELFAMS